MPKRLNSLSFMWQNNEMKWSLTNAKKKKQKLVISFFSCRNIFQLFHNLKDCQELTQLTWQWNHLVLPQKKAATIMLSTEFKKNTNNKNIRKYFLVKFNGWLKNDSISIKFIIMCLAGDIQYCKFIGKWKRKLSLTIDFSSN